ncbi:MAG TPA: hypothetical protein VKS22_03965 [Candidatus Binataceae bacterium]|nr:hypothetical protein [Candidatus Binataceae bacterium]
MAGDKRSQGLVKFWWVLAATLGAAAGAAAESLWGPANTLGAIAGIGLSLALAVGYLERPIQPGATTPRWPRPRWRQPAPRRRPESAKSSTPRAKLHAVNGRKRGAPPVSGTPDARR